MNDEHETGQTSTALDRILVGYDGTPEGEDALSLARTLAGAAPVTAVCVYETIAAGALPSAVELQHQVRAAAESKVTDLAADGIAAIAVAATSPARGLHRVAEHRSADLIVVGSQHHGTLSRVLTGSAAEGLLRDAPCAVAVAPRGFHESSPEALGVIAVAYDDSPEAHRALDIAVALARRTGARLRLVHVHEIGVAVSGGGAYVALGELEQELRAADRQRLEEAASGVQGVEIETRLIEGPLSVLGELDDVDLMIGGSRGYGPLRRVIAGSTSVSLIRHAHYPIVICPRGADADAPPADYAREELATAGRQDA